MGGWSLPSRASAGVAAEALPAVRAPERDPGTERARVAQGVAHAAGRDADAGAPLRGRGHRGGRLGRLREVHGGGGGQALARGVPGRRYHPWRPPPSLGAGRSPAPTPPAAAADDAAVPNDADRASGGRGARARRDTHWPPARLRPAGADAGVRAKEAPDPRPPQGRERDPGALRSVPDSPARRTGGSDAALPARRSPAPVPMACPRGGAHIPRDSAARPRPSPRRPARAGRATKPHAAEARRAGADGVPAPAPREVLGARARGRLHLPDSHRRDGRGDRAAGQAPPVERAVSGAVSR